MADPPPSSAPPARRSGVSIALICIGLLILAPSGLCTAFFGSSFLMALSRPGEAAAYARGFLPLVAMFGGPPIALGLALLLWGLMRDRR